MANRNNDIPDKATEAGEANTETHKHTAPRRGADFTFCSRCGLPVVGWVGGGHCPHCGSRACPSCGDA